MLFDTKLKKKYLKENLRPSLLNDIRIANPIFLDSIILYPTLSGKIIVVDIAKKSILFVYFRLHSIILVIEFILFVCLRLNSIILVIESILFVCFRLHSIILVIESILFGLFVMAIGCDQVRY